MSRKRSVNWHCWFCITEHCPWYALVLSTVVLWGSHINQKATQVRSLRCFFLCVSLIRAQNNASFSLDRFFLDYYGNQNHCSSSWPNVNLERLTTYLNSSEFFKCCCWITFSLFFLPSLPLLPVFRGGWGAVPVFKLTLSPKAMLSSPLVSVCAISAGLHF